MDQPTGKRCTKCGETKPLAEFGRDKVRQDGLTPWCKECKREQNRRYRKANPEKVSEYNRQWAEANPSKRLEHKRRYREGNRDKEREGRRRYREQNRDKELERIRRYHDSTKATVLDHYGRSCACCGSTENPTIDHVNGGGEAHRREIGQSQLYRWLIRNGFPEGFQTLCSPCNCSKGTGTACRINHQPERAPARPIPLPGPDTAIDAA